MSNAKQEAQIRKQIKKRVETKFMQYAYDYCKEDYYPFLRLTAEE